MKHNLKRYIGLLLVIVMVAGMMPASALADTFTSNVIGPLTLEEEEVDFGEPDPSADLESEGDFIASLHEVQLKGLPYNQRLLAVAETQLGYTESETNFVVKEDEVTGKKAKFGITRYGQWYGLPYEDWCAMFISFCLHYGQVPNYLMPADSGAFTWVNRLQSMGLFRWRSEYTPKPGDLIFFDNDLSGQSDHVGIVSSLFTVDGVDMVETIEGNHSKTVEKFSYPLISLEIQGYGVMSDENPDAAAEEKQLVADYASGTDTYRVTMTYTADALIPANAVLVVSEILPGTPEYDAYVAESAGALGWEENSVSDAKVLDISVFADGVEVQPAAPVNVEMVLVDQPAEDWNVVHFGKEETQVLESTAEGDAVSFATDGFSIFVFAKSKLEKTLVASDGNTYNITLTYDDKAGIPDNAELKVTEILQEVSEDPDASSEYDEYLSRAEGALEKNQRVTFARFFDITILVDGQEIQPAAPVEVKIELADEELTAEETEDVKAVHFSSEGDVTALDTTRDSQTVTFNADGFSVYGIVGTERIVVDYLTKDGSTYQISVDIPAEANIPAGSDLIVEELVEGSTKYSEYLEKTANALNLNKDEVGYIKLLDISIVKDGQEIQPDVPVSVSIELKDKDDASNTQVIHFEDKPVLMDVDTSGNTVSFETSGFSVYAVIGDIDPTSRMTVNFYGKDTETPLATMYVKNEDDLEQVTKILFDPGAGTLSEGEIFRGWVIGDVAHEGTTASMPEYTVEMASTEGTLKTIEDIRIWAAGFDAEGDNRISEGDVVNIRAAIYKNYVITYLDDKGIAQSADSVLIMPDAYSAYYEYKISQSYTPVKDTVRFNGWVPTEETKNHITSDTQQGDNLYQKDDVIHITGNVDFKVDQSEGHWIVFHENGKGGTYKAPQFVETGYNTVDPGAMARKGYTFGGWYTEVTGDADSHGYKQVVESSGFTFGDDLDDFGDGKLNLYAKWTPNETAPYTIIFWGQKIGSDGKIVEGEYEVLETFVNNNGRVGQKIPYISRDNGDEDYAYQTDQGAFGSRTDELPNGSGTEEKGMTGHYRGFNLTENSKNQEVTITPEGDAVLNLYYDRVEYKFKFYLYRESGNGTYRYTYANGSSNGSTLNDLVTWHNGSSNHPSAPSYTDQTEQHRFNNTNYTYHYFTISAHYGEDISAIWPTYDKIQGADNRVPVSYVMMVPTHLKEQATGTGTDTVKGIISVMNWNILGNTADANGNYVIVRFPNNYFNWRYHIWYETVEGEDYTGKNTYTYNGKTYYEDSVMHVRSSNIQDKSQNEPKYDGFEYVTRMGQNQQGVWGGGHWAYNAQGNWAGQNNTENSNWEYHLNYIYNRQQFKITYFDGNYVDGDGNTIQNNSSDILHESGLIPQGAVIPDTDSNYVPDAPEAGYVFEGWYLDAGCTTPYTWGTMPVGPINGGSAIKVYAKWQQIEYRVYLQSNVPAGEEFTWGSDDQATCFRVSYGDTVSLPVGRDREGWEFLGWYTTPNFEPSSRFTEDYELTEENVTTRYDQNTEYTDTYDKWGNLNDPKGNTDKTNNRDWITKKLVLYAKWHQVLEGAEGINIVYDPILAAEGVEPPTGHNPPTDNAYYIDTAEATAQAGSTADNPDEYQFECWVMQRWNGTAFVDTDVEVYPGDTFEVLKANAKEEDYTDPENPAITKKYTVHVRAKYKPVEDPTPTHIDWYKNYEENGKHEAFHQDPALHINEAVGIQPAQTREGYKFLGWARVPEETSHSHVPEGGTVPVADVLNLSSDDLYIKWEDNKFKARNENDEWVVVTEVAADEKIPYHDMYAVWERKTYSVTVKKEVESGLADDQTKEFDFTITGVAEQDVTTKLVGDATKENHSVIYTEIPYGTSITVTETEDTAFDTTYSVNGAEEESELTATFTVNEATVNEDGIAEVVFTNTRSKQLVKVFKYETGTNPEKALQGAQFSLTGPEGTAISYTGLTTNADGYLVYNNSTLLELPVNESNYILTETKAPNGYNIMTENVVFTVSNGGVTGSGSGFAVETGTETVEDATVTVYTIKVQNTAGTVLPETGGVGTDVLAAIGGVMALFAGAVLVLRRRRRANEA